MNERVVISKVMNEQFATAYCFLTDYTLLRFIFPLGVEKKIIKFSD